MDDDLQRVGLHALNDYICEMSKCNISIQSSLLDIKFY